jgi:hypothetical protein
MKSDHATLLNSLNEMSQSWLYAARRPVLEEAERVIYRQERVIYRQELEIKQLKEDLADKVNTARALFGLGDDWTEWKRLVDKLLSTEPLTKPIIEPK